MSTHNLCFKQKYEKYQNFYLQIFLFLVVKFSIYLNRHVFVMCIFFFYIPKKIRLDISCKLSAGEMPSLFTEK